MFFHRRARLRTRNLGQQQNLLCCGNSVLGNGSMNLLRPELSRPFALKAESSSVREIGTGQGSGFR
jgi:hypothetical protein